MSEKQTKLRAEATSSKNTGFDQWEGAVTGLMDAAIDLSGGVENRLLGNRPSDGIDDMANSAAKVATKFGPWGYLAAGVIKAGNFLNKAGGENIKGFEGNTGSAGFQDFSMADKHTRGNIFAPISSLFTTSAVAKDYYNQVEKKKSQFAQAKSLVDESRKQNQARFQAADNVGRRNQSILSGNNDYSAILAQKGAALENMKEAVKNPYIKRPNPISIFNDVLSSIKNTTIEQFKQGGSVIPSGSLHKDKHNLDAEGLQGKITKKGIPVVSVEEGGEVIQHAEIEKEEIIIEISLSKKLEKLWKDGSDDAAIEAGRLLANEIMEDTTDNANLLNKPQEL